MLAAKYQRVNVIVELLNRHYIIAQDDPAFKCDRFKDAIQFAWHAGMIVEQTIFEPNMTTGKYWRLPQTNDRQYVRFACNGRREFKDMR